MSNRGSVAVSASSVAAPAAAALASCEPPLSNVPVELPLLQGVIFDMDGTLTVPNLDFKGMYAKCGVAMSDDLLAAIAAMPADDAARARGVVDAMEAEGRASLQLAGGVAELAAWLQRHGVKTALVTRNSGATVDALRRQLWAPAGLPPFDVTVSRDSPAGVAAKPDPAALRLIADRWGLALPCAGLVMVGDSPANDVAFGAAAGVATALVDSGRRYLEEAAVDEGGAVAKGGSHAGPGLGGVNGGRGVGGGADMCVASLALLPRLLWQRFTVGGALGTAMPLEKYDTPAPTTPAGKAAFTGDAAALAHLSAAELGAQDASGNSPLVWAAEGGQAACVAALLATPGVNVDAAGYLGATALNRASRRGNADVVTLLLAAGASPDAPNAKHQFPLHFAAYKQHPLCVAALLAGGASPLVLDRKGRTPSEDTSDRAIRDVLLAARQAALDAAPRGLLDVQ